MADESYWVDRAQTAEARLGTLKAAYEPAIERVRQFKTNFGLKERADGSIVIDFECFVTALGPTGCLELREEIDKQWNISGAPGAKPRMRVQA